MTRSSAHSLRSDTVAVNASGEIIARPRLRSKAQIRDGLSWQITLRVLTDALRARGAEANRAFAMMPMKKIDIATIEAVAVSRCTRRSGIIDAWE